MLTVNTKFISFVACFMLATVSAQGAAHEEELEALRATVVNVNPNRWDSEQQFNNTNELLLKALDEICPAYYFLNPRYPAYFKEALRHGATIKYITLTTAARIGNTDVVKVLRDAGVDVNDATCGNTALIGASYYGHTETVNVLIRAGADVTATDNDGRTAQEWASSLGHTAIVELLLNRNTGVTELMWASLNG